MNKETANKMFNALGRFLFSGHAPHLSHELIWSRATFS